MTVLWCGSSEVKVCFGSKKQENKAARVQTTFVRSTDPHGENNKEIQWAVSQVQAGSIHPECLKLKDY